MYAIVCRVVTEFYKQLHITLQVLKIFQFLFRFLPLKLNKEENETLLLEFLLSGQNVHLQHWKFSIKHFVRYVKKPFSYHISFQIGMCK